MCLAECCEDCISEFYDPRDEGPHDPYDGRFSPRCHVCAWYHRDGYDAFVRLGKPLAASDPGLRAEEHDGSEMSPVLLALSFGAPPNPLPFAGGGNAGKQEKALRGKLGAMEPGKEEARRELRQRRTRAWAQF